MNELEILRLKAKVRKLERKKKHKFSKVYKSLEKAIAKRKIRVRVIHIKNLQKKVNEHMLKDKFLER